MKKLRNFILFLASVMDTEERMTREEEIKMDRVLYFNHGLKLSQLDKMSIKDIEKFKNK